MVVNFNNELLGGNETVDNQQTAATEQPVATEQPAATEQPVATEQPTISDQKKYMNIVATINKRYNDFKKSLYDYAKTENLTENELYILIPSNDEPYISDNNFDKLIFQKMTSKIIVIGKNDHVTDAQVPFYNPKIKINS